MSSTVCEGMGGHRLCMCGHGWTWVQFKRKMSGSARVEAARREGNDSRT